MLVARARVPAPVTQDSEPRSAVDVAQGGEHRGLAGAVEADEAHGLAGLEGEGDVGEDRAVALVPGGQSLDLKEVGGIVDGAHELGGVRSSRSSSLPPTNGRISWYRKSAATAMATTAAVVSPRRMERTVTMMLSTTATIRRILRARSVSMVIIVVAARSQTDQLKQNEHRSSGEEDRHRHVAPLNRQDRDHDVEHHDEQ